MYDQFLAHHHRSQALARVVITWGCAVYGGVLYLVYHSLEGLLAAAVAGVYGILALGYYALARRARTIGRAQWLTIPGDIGALSLVVLWSGFVGLSVYPVYLWVIVGNGLRFGHRHFISAGIAGVIGFSAANAFNGAWRETPYIISGLTLGLAVLPIFYATVVKAMHEALRTQTDYGYRLAEQLSASRRAAELDSLTGLSNRARLNEWLQHAIALASRRDQELVGVLYIDLDRFKQINDRHGHPSGDRVLVEAARRIRACIRQSDTAARVGGDEFLVLLECLSSSADAFAVAEAIAKALARPYELDVEQTVEVSASIGVAWYPDHGDDPASLIQAADRAMYAAKARGGGVAGAQREPHAPAPTIGETG